MKKAFSLLEILMTVFLIAIFLLLFSGWAKRSGKTLSEIEDYYLRGKKEILEEIRQGNGETAVLTSNIVLKIVTVNGRTFEYLKYK